MTEYYDFWDSIVMPIILIMALPVFIVVFLVSVAVTVGVAVGSGVAVRVAVAVRVGVGVRVAVRWGVGVGVTQRNWLQVALQQAPSAFAALSHASPACRMPAPHTGQFAYGPLAITLSTRGGLKTTPLPINGLAPLG